MGCDNINYAISKVDSFFQYSDINMVLKNKISDFQCSGLLPWQLFRGWVTQLRVIWLGAWSSSASSNTQVFVKKPYSIIGFLMKILVHTLNSKWKYTLWVSLSNYTVPRSCGTQDRVPLTCRGLCFTYIISTHQETKCILSFGAGCRLCMSETY